MENLVSSPVNETTLDTLNNVEHYLTEILVLSKPQPVPRQYSPGVLLPPPPSPPHHSDHSPLPNLPPPLPPPPPPPPPPFPPPPHHVPLQDFYLRQLHRSRTPPFFSLPPYHRPPPSYPLSDDSHHSNHQAQTHQVELEDQAEEDVLRELVNPSLPIFSQATASLPSLPQSSTSTAPISSDQKIVLEVIFIVFVLLFLLFVKIMN
jgi:hypothetical protein